MDSRTHLARAVLSQFPGCGAGWEKVGSSGQVVLATDAAGSGCLGTRWSVRLAPPVTTAAAVPRTCDGPTTGRPPKLKERGGETSRDGERRQCWGSRGGKGRVSVGVGGVSDCFRSWAEGKGRRLRLCPPGQGKKPCGVERTVQSPRGRAGEGRTGKDEEKRDELKEKENGDGRESQEASHTADYGTTPQPYKPDH